MKWISFDLTFEKIINLLLFKMTSWLVKIKSRLSSQIFHHFFKPLTSLEPAKCSPNIKIIMFSIFIGIFCCPQRLKPHPPYAHSAHSMINIFSMLTSYSSELAAEVWLTSSGLMEHIDISVLISLTCI